MAPQDQPRPEPGGQPGISRAWSDEFQTPPAKRRAVESPSSQQLVAASPTEEEEEAADSKTKRALQALSSKLKPGSPPVFYRLDYLFGRSPQAVATPSQTTPSPKQQQALARLEQEAEQAVKDCGLDLVAASRSQKGRGKRGRPPGSFKTGAAVAGVRKSRADATAAGKLRLVRELKALKDSPAYSKTTARRELQNRYALSETAVRNLEKEGVETRLAEFLSHRQVGLTARRRAGSHLALFKLGSRSEGKRIAKAGQAWAGRTCAAQCGCRQQCGHSLRRLTDSSSVPETS
ncbi:MAG: hypothetical protein NXI08_16640 [bacterium]|nr:hypothetical protein [bacterium]